MKKLIILSLLLISTLNALAQESKLEFFISPGISIISSPGNLGDLWSPGFGVSLGLEYPLSKNLSLQVRLSFDIATPAHDPFLRQFFGPNTTANIKDYSITDGKASFWGGIINVKFEIPMGAKLSPYLIGGGGIVFFNVQSITITGPLIAGSRGTSFIDPKGYPAVDFGLGLDFKIANKAKLFVEGSGIKRLLILRQIALFVQLRKTSFITLLEVELA